MIQIKIPPEHADTVRAALTCADTGCHNGQHWRQTAPDNMEDVGPCDAPQSFWLGVALPELVDWAGVVPDRYVLPVDVAKMLEPCEHDESTWDEDTGYGCCRDTGRPLVELVTDCWACNVPRGVETDPDDHNHHPDDGYVSLGTAIAVEQWPIVGTQPVAPPFECIEMVKHGKGGRITLLHFRDGERMRSTFVDVVPLDPAKKPTVAIRLEAVR